MKIVAMIPARMGSQRLKQKNLKEINGKPLLQIAIEKCQNTKVFDEIWVNSESDVFGEVAYDCGAKFHKRPAELANNSATSEDFIYEFLDNHECTHVVQVHSIAPLLSENDIKSFVDAIRETEASVFLSYEQVQIECSYKDKPINFSYSSKTNSQELSPVQRVSWAITAWKKMDYLKNYEAGKCATYSGKIEYIPIGKLASHVVKVEEDLQIARLLFDHVNQSDK